MRTEHKASKTWRGSICSSASLAIFTMTTAFLLSNCITSLSCHLAHADLIRSREADATLVHSMILLTPSYIFGVLLGVIAYRRNETRSDNIQLAIRLNCWALVPVNVIPLLCHFFGLARV